MAGAAFCIVRAKCDVVSTGRCVVRNVDGHRKIQASATRHGDGIGRGNRAHRRPQRTGIACNIDFSAVRVSRGDGNGAGRPAPGNCSETRRRRQGVVPHIQNQFLRFNSRSCSTGNRHCVRTRSESCPAKSQLSLGRIRTHGTGIDVARTAVVAARTGQAHRAAETILGTDGNRSPRAGHPRFDID